MTGGRLTIWGAIAAAVLVAWASTPAYSGRRGPPAGRGGPNARRFQQERPARAPGRAPAPAAAPQEQPESSGPTLVTGPEGETTISMEFYGADIDHILRLFSRAAGVTILKSQQVTGKLTVISPEPVSLEEGFQILNEVLAVRSVTMVRTPSGNYKVMPIEEAMQSPLPLQFGARPEDVPASDDLITQVVPLLNLDANDVIAQIQGMMSGRARLIATSTNSLIMTDTSANIQQALTIIADLENQLSSGPRIFPIQHRDAEEMANLVDGYILGRGGGGARAARPTWERRVTRPGTAARTPARPGTAPAAGRSGAGPEFCYPDKRTNSLVVLATPDHQRQIEEFIFQLDRPISLRDTFFHYPVQNLMASELAEMVAPLVGAEVKTAGSSRAQGGRQTSAAGGMRSPFGSPQAGGPRGGTGWSPRSMGRLRGQSSDIRGTTGLEVQPLAGAGDAPATPGAVAGQPAARMVQPMPQVAPQPELPVGQPPGLVAEEAAPMTLGSESLIVADDNSNTLLISAPPEQMDLIQQMLEELDVLPPQVHIRAIIAEVTMTRDTSLGFQWNWLQTLGPYGGAEVVGDFATDFGLGESGEEGETGSGLGLFGQISSDEFAGVLHALTTDSRVRILSSPTIFTANNETARTSISQGIPFVTGIIDYPTGVGASSRSVTYEDVGIVLEVTPRVTQGNVVRMDIDVQANELGSSISVAGQDFPSTNQRVARGVVNVKHGYTVVLGGLMRDSIRRSATRVPILGDIPIIGSLFRSTSSKREKSELLLFLTPHVVRTPTEAARLTDRAKSRLPEVPRMLQPPADEPTPAAGPATTGR